MHLGPDLLSSIRWTDEPGPIIRAALHITRRTRGLLSSVRMHLGPDHPPRAMRPTQVAQRSASAAFSSSIIFTGPGSTPRRAAK